MIENKVLEIYAPVSGKTVPIESVPDLVFAQKTIGDGISVAPSSYVLCAPCGGTVANIHSAHHALTIQTPQGIEVLMHIGLDTVLLKGEGFDLKTAVGRSVKTGDPLIAFDRDLIEQNGKSLLTEIVIANMDRTAGITAEVNKDVRAGKDVILKVELKDGLTAAPSVSAAGVHTESWEIEIKNPAGLHARPIAVLVSAAKQFDSDIFLQYDGRTANAKSLVAVMGLDVKKGDRVRLTADGADAENAMKKLIPLIETGLGEDLTKPAEAPAAKPAAVSKNQDKDGVFSGVSASPGAAVGVVVQLQDVAIEVEEFGATPGMEKSKLAAALAEAGQQLSDLFEQTQKTAGSDKAAIFAAHQELLADPELLAESEKLIDQGRSAAFAWQQTVNKQAAALAEMKNELLAGRANDLRDVGKRVLRLLTGKVEQKLSLPENTVLIAHDLSPSDTASLDRERVVGFATVGGGASSHAAILARSLLLPAVSGLSPNVLNILNGTPVLLDGTKGELRLNPGEAEKQAAARQEQAERKMRAELLESKDEPAVTTDNVRLEVGGNIAGIEGAQEVVALGGEGVGLLRSEFLFSGRKDPPSEDEQTAVYRAIAETLGNDRTLIVRTLDVGGDKPLSFMPTPKEDNPFLGVRGLRLSLLHPDVFRSQIRAVLRAADKTKVRIMFPMVTVLEELLQAKQIVEEEQKNLGVSSPIETGIMIEVPAAAMMADILAPYVDFFSVGTNDLTQYTMASDRGNALLSSLSDALHPAVLRMIRATVDGAEKAGKWVGVCGAMAGDENAVPVLVGLGVRELSVAPPVIPAVKARIRSLSFERCRDLAQVLTGQEKAADVHQKIKDFLAAQE